MNGGSGDLGITSLDSRDWLEVVPGHCLNRSVYVDRARNSKLSIWWYLSRDISWLHSALKSFKLILWQILQALSDNFQGFYNNKNHWKHYFPMKLSVCGDYCWIVAAGGVRLPICKNECRICSWISHKLCSHSADSHISHKIIIVIVYRDLSVWATILYLNLWC